MPPTLQHPFEASPKARTYWVTAQAIRLVGDALIATLIFTFLSTNSLPPIYAAFWVVIAMAVARRVLTMLSRTEIPGMNAHYEEEELPQGPSRWREEIISAASSVIQSGILATFAATALAPMAHTTFAGVGYGLSFVASASLAYAVVKRRPWRMASSAIGIAVSFFAWSRAADPVVARNLGQAYTVMVCLAFAAMNIRTVMAVGSNMIERLAARFTRAMKA